jgi:hypothetical protein
MPKNGKEKLLKKHGKWDEFNRWKNKVLFVCTIFKSCWEFSGETLFHSIG